VWAVEGFAGEAQGWGAKAIYARRLVPGVGARWEWLDGWAGERDNHGADSVRWVRRARCSAAAYDALGKRRVVG
jgi:hypothetical protein